MKTFIMALAAAILIAGQLFTPAAAAPTTAGLANELCGSTYTVKHADNLTKIASLCDTTIANILANNSQITDPNIIYTGQVLRLTGGAVRYSTTYTVRSGDTMQEIADMFDTTVTAILRANPGVTNASSIYTGLVLNIPSGSTYTGYTGNARVTLSTTRGESGDTITVYVRGFPANSYIDYRVGEEEEDYSVVYDGTVGSDGTDSITITIPNDADEGEYWVVLVTTTSQRDGVEAVSPTIYIDD